MLSGAEPTHGFLVEPDDRPVVAADDQQGRRLDAGQGIGREIGSTAARDHGTHRVRAFRGGDERGRRASTRAEQAERIERGRPLVGQPVHGRREAPGEHRDVEPQFGGDQVAALLVGGEQVEQDRAQFRAVQDLATYWLRGLCRLLPLPCANTTTPLARVGSVSSTVYWVPVVIVGTHCKPLRLVVTRADISAVSRVS